MQTYLVGGAVRDSLLGLPVRDRDWVVVGADAETMLAQGFLPVGKDFPVFLHPDSREEYALARTERKTAKGYTGFAFHADKDVTLEQDLMRRDLTINAIAQSSDGLIIDPFGGEADLRRKILRHVSPAFAEDPVRILRTARFAARYGFEVAEETMCLMRQMVEAGEADALVAERVWQELAKGLMEKQPRRMFEILRECGALKVLLPEIDALFGIPQPAAHHPEIDCGLHTLMVLQRAADMNLGLPARYAALLHALGKALTPPDLLPKHHGHDPAGIAPGKPPLACAETMCRTGRTGLPLAHRPTQCIHAQNLYRIECITKNRRIPPPRTLSDGLRRLPGRYTRTAGAGKRTLPPTRPLACPFGSRRPNRHRRHRRRLRTSGTHSGSHPPRQTGSHPAAAQSPHPNRLIERSGTEPEKAV